MVKPVAGYRSFACGVLAAAALSCLASGCSTGYPLSTSAGVQTADNTPSSVPSCEDSAELVAAVDTVWQAGQNPALASVYGAEGGSRTTNLFDLLNYDNLAAIENPIGTGILVSVVYAGDDVFARQTAKRTGWLVLDDWLYPVNVEGSAAFGLLWDGYPDDVKVEAGLGEDYFDFESYGISEFVSFNADTTSKLHAFMNEANGLCHPPTGLGR